jgi:hypothetical protein
MEILIFSGEKFKLVERGRNGREMAYGKRIGTGEGHPAVSGETGDNPQESGGSVPGQPFVSWERFRYEGISVDKKEAAPIGQITAVRRQPPAERISFPKGSAFFFFGYFPFSQTFPSLGCHHFL